MSSIENFVKVYNNDGYGYGSSNSSGYGYGRGYGYGDGCGSGDSCDYGDGDRDGCGYGDGDGCGYGYGDGYGDGYGYSDGNDYGDGSNENIKSFNGNPVYYIDSISTIIIKVRKNVAKGFILNNDLTTTPCYIVKQNNTFAHGATLSEAREALRDKLFEDMDEEERIDAFLDEFNLSDKYPAKNFFDWHNRLTGSCEQGRRTFVKNHDIDLENDSFTVAEFCEICKNDYGGNIIKEILERIS